MNRKKIAILKYSFDILGGAEVVAIKLAKELSMYHDVYIVSIATSFKENIPKVENVSYFNIFDEKKRVRDIIISGSKRLRKYLLSNCIDIVFSIGMNSNAIMLLSTFFTNIKTVNCDHTTIHNDFGNKFYALQRFLGAKFSNKSVVLTEENKSCYLDKYRLSESKVECIYNWVDNHEINEDVNLVQKKIITVGRFSREKGYNLLKEVAQKVYEKYPDWTWDIYGDGEQHIYNDLSLLANVNLKGIVKGVNNIYPGHSIYVMTSYFEGLPLVLLEAKQFRLPIVSFNCPTGPSEIVRDGINGFLIQNYSVDLMVEKLSLLIENENLRKSFSDNALLDIDKFSKDRIIKQWLNLIETL